MIELGVGHVGVPGEKAYNLIVVKEKSVFQDEGPCRVCLVRKRTRGLEKRIVAAIDWSLMKSLISVLTSQW